MNPRYSSQECPKCGHIHKDNRNKEKFICTNCGYLAHADLKAAVTVKQRGIEALGLTLSCRAKLEKNLVRRDSSKPAQLDLGLELCEMPTSESTEGKRRRSARKSKREVPGNSEQPVVAVQSSLFRDNLAYTAKAK